MNYRKENLYKNSSILLVISLYAYFINWFSGNMGVLPIDSFGFLDTGYSILKGNLPIRDFWIFTGFLVDYMEAAFLYLFGNNWNSHLAHSSFMNILATCSFFFFLKEFNFNIKHSIFFSICFATLCYPVSGTPFAYIHAYIFSLMSIFILIVAIKNKSNILWFILPFVCLFSFLSMQTPTIYILIIISIFSGYYFFKHKHIKNLNSLILGVFLSLFIFFSFLYFTKTPLINFIYQYILFPITIGESRITNETTAYVSLVDQLNLKRLFGEFKFVHFFLLPLIFLSFKNFKKNSAFKNLLNLIIIFSTFLFLFNQLITANQIFIFSLVPVLAAVLYLNLEKINFNKKIIYLIFILVLFATLKFHKRFNIDRKFHELENVNMINAINAKTISKNFNQLKWLSKFEDPKIEINVIKKAKSIIEDEKKKMTLITHYQFFSTILDKNLNIMNRWYLWDNNTHPTENHKYFKFYKSFINENIKKKKIEVIYLLGEENSILFKNIKNYFSNICFENTIIIKNKFSKHEIVNCNNNLNN